MSDVHIVAAKHCHSISNLCASYGGFALTGDPAPQVSILSRYVMCSV